MRKRPGFTLIEMLLATVLMSVLMVGVLAVITRVAQPISTPIREAGLASMSITTDTVVRTLLTDLAQAREVDIENNQIMIKGCSGLDPRTKERDQRPVNVRYRIQTLADQSWLVREEQRLDLEGPQAVSFELVASGYSRLSLEPPQIVVVDDSKEQSLPRDGRWLLRLWSDTDQRMVERSVVLQRSLAQ